MSFLIALGLTVVLYLVTYLLLFLSYMNLVLKHPDKKRGYHIPGGNPVKLLVATSGLVVSLLAFGISFIPPSSLSNLEADRTYVSLLVISFLVMFAIPFILYALHDKKAKRGVADMVHIKYHNAPEGHFWMHPKARGSHHLIPTADSLLDQTPHSPDTPKV